MDNQIYNELNSGAKALLDSYFEDYRNKILDYIAEKAIDKNRRIAEFRASDIFEIQQTIEQSGNKSIRNDKKLRMFLMFSILGSIYALVGILFFYIQVRSSTRFFIQETDIIMGLFPIMGILISFISSFMLFFTELNVKRISLKTYTFSHNEYLIEIIDIWNSIEKIAMSKYVENENGTKSNVQAINWLMKTDDLSSNDRESLRKIINARNIAVHKGDDNSLSRTELKEIINEGKNILKKLSL
ncbi:MAG: hypothetical protein LBU84_14685 [Prevotella sp.]|jgi:hypothetical protein|nr:hypothetical protein [Prevotella sp.]